MRQVFAVILFFLPFFAGCASFAPGMSARNAESPPHRQLGPHLAESFQSEVLVFGTAHLAGLDDALTPAHLASTRRSLQRFAPTRIAVELLSADEIALLEEHAAHDPAAAKVIDMFAQHIVELGRLARTRTGLARVAAHAAAQPLLARSAALSTAERIHLVELLLAAYEYPSALLQWSSVSPALRATAALPETMRARLDRALASSGEVVTLALPLARALGLARIHAIDSQYEAVRTLSAPRAALEDLYSDPARGEFRDLDATRRDEELRDRAMAQGELLPYFLHLNAPAHLAHDVLQWRWLFKAHHESGLDRLRYAMWELRNQRIAVNVIDAAASTRPERVLVIIGSAHKLPLDEALDDLLSTRLRHFREFTGAQ